MPDLLALADQVDKLQAICTVCGAPATKTFRMTKTNDHKAVIVADDDVFQARCQMHYSGDEDDKNALAFTSFEE